jgi:hypothetical protein
MHPVLRKEFEKEMALARDLYGAAKYREAFAHLERAHVLGQRHAWPHTVNHWWMLKTGVRLRDAREVFGQLPRTAFGGIGSLLGRVPLGNTGGANVGIFTPMTIPPDLAEILERAR